MKQQLVRSIRPLLGIIAILPILAACADRSAVEPDPFVTQFTNTAGGPRGVDLGECDSLAVPAGSKLAFQTYATGVQIYQWNGTTWGFVAPSATLFADAGRNGVVGTHYAGPRWESNSGSIVLGSVLKRCTPDASAIQWLLLAATPEGNGGIFARVTFIQRVNTKGGLAPSTPGSAVGEMTEVPYTAEYLFYR